MKKVIVALTVLAMISLIGFTAFATMAEGATGDAIVTASGNTTIDLVLIDNFAGTNGAIGVWDPDGDGTQSTVRATGEFATVSGQQSFVMKTCDYGNIATFSINPQDAGGNWATWINNRGDTALGANTKALVYKLTNGNAKAGLGIEGTRWDEGSGKTGYLCAGADVLLVNSEGLVQKAELVYHAWGRYLAMIPANFDGYLVVPTANITSSSEEGASGDWNVDNFCKYWQLGFFLSNESEETQAVLTIHDFYVSNEDIPAIDQVDFVTESADLSVIAYAAAALVGCGALVVAKKRA